MLTQSERRMVRRTYLAARTGRMTLCRSEGYATMYLRRKRGAGRMARHWTRYERERNPKRARYRVPMWLQRLTHA